MTTNFCLFDTSFGRCALAWNAVGISGASFPEVDDQTTNTRLLRANPNAKEAAPNEPAAKAINAVQKLLDMGEADFSEIPLDISALNDFDKSVLTETLKIAPGQVLTYGAIAKTLGDIAFSRRVGQALGRNPIPIIIPCHRVVGADGQMTGFSAPGGAHLKRQLLKLEGALPPDLFDT